MLKGAIYFRDRKRDDLGGIRLGRNQKYNIL